MSKQQASVDVLTGNKLIAEFMGGNVMSTYTAANGKDYSSSGPVESVKDWSKAFLKYHSSWDWLMPVVEKIETSADQKTGHITVEIAENHCRIYQYSHIKELIKTYDPKSKINSVWQAVVKFITWYNQNKQS